MGKFTYKKRTAADVEKRARQYSGNYDSFVNSEFPLLKVKEGENNLRIMRRTWSDDDCDQYGDGFELKVQIHFGVGPDNATYLCNAKMKGEACPVCDARREADDEEEARKMAPNGRSICWVIDRNNEKGGPQVWSVPATLMKELINRTVIKKTGDVLEVDDWDNGYDVTFVREGTDQRTKYTQAEYSREPTPLHDNPKTQAKWIAYVESHPLPDVLNYYDEEYIEKVLKGKKAKPSRDDDDEEDERPRKTAKRAASRDDEEDEDERRASRTKSKREEVDEEDEDDEPAQSQKSQKNGKRAVLDEDEEDDEPKTRVVSRSAKARRDADEDEEGEEGEDDATSSQQARKGLDRLKTRGAERR